MSIYLKIERSTGKLYEKSNGPKENFVRVETTNPQTGATVISYRRYMPFGVFGRLQAMYLKEGSINGKPLLSLCVQLVDGEERYSIDIPYKDQKGNIDNFADSFITYMPFLKKDEAYHISPFVAESKDQKTAKGDARKRYMILVKYAQLSNKAIDTTNKIQRLENSYFDKETRTMVEKDIPAIEWVENFDGGSTPNKLKRNKFLHETMQKYSIEYSGGGGGMRTFNKFESQEPFQDAPQPENVQKVQEAPATVAAGQEEDDDDDLPF
jgi:hypothetical protein